MRRWTWPLVVTAALGGMIGWRLQTKRLQVAGQASARERRMKAPPVVSVSPAVARDVVNAFEAVGTVDAPLNVRISPRISGRIDFLQVHEGDRVRRGEVLVRIDPSEVLAQLRQREADAAEAASRVAQARFTQRPTNVSVGTQIAQQNAAVESADADRKQVKENYTSQTAAADAAVTSAQGRLSSAKAGVAGAEAGVRSAQANLENARARHSRVDRLYRQGFVAAQDVDDAATAVKVQEGNLEVARGELNAAGAARDSAEAELESARRQADIVRVKGKADIAAAEARLVQAQEALKYARANQALSPAYKENIAALKAAEASARASVGTARAQLSYTVLASPIDGFVTGRYMDPGAMAAPGQPVLAVQEMREVWVTVPVPEEVSRKVFVGQAADVAFDAVPGRSFAGKVTQLNPSADPVSRQFTARVTLDNARREIKPGMFARARIITDRVRGALVVPREAVQQGPEGTTVVVVDRAGVAHRRPVKTGASDAAGFAVTEGLEVGEKVVVLSGMPLKDGQQVRLAGEGRPGGRPGRPGR